MSASADSERTARLYAGEDTAARELKVTMETTAEGLVRIRPSAPIVAGTQLRLETSGRACEGKSSLTARVVVSAEAALPTRLGTARLTASGQKTLHVGVKSGECFLPMRAAFAEIELDLSSEARPYADLMRYALRIDGAPTLEYEAPADWMTADYLSNPPLGDGSLGRTAFRVFAPCEAASRPEARQWPALGSHGISIAGTLPDGTSIETDKLDVELRCDLAQVEPVAADAGSTGARPAASDASTPPDAVVQSEPETDTDASVPPSSVQSEGAEAQEAPVAAESASCALRPSDGPGAAAIALAALALLSLKARRRRAKQS